jgi:hypothetical protein
MEKNTAENPVVTREAKTWKSRVNAIIWCVRKRFGSSHLKVPPIWLTENNTLRRRTPSDRIRP